MGRLNKNHIIIGIVALALLAFAWHTSGWKSAALLCGAISGALVFDSIFGKGKLIEMLLGIVLLAFAFILLNSVFDDMVTTLKISFGFLLLKGSLDFFIGAFEKPLHAWFRFRSKEPATENHNEDKQNPLNSLTTSGQPQVPGKKNHEKDKN